MQQIGMTGRFWWRALDAPTPRPLALQPAGFQAPGAWSYPARRQQKPAASRNAAILTVPKDQQRQFARRPSKSRQTGIAVFVMAAALASMTAAAILFPGKVHDARAALALGQRASAALIVAGFGIDQVSVSGHRFTPDADVYDALDLPNTRTFAAFDAAAALKRIERLPWVDTAQITRVFPGSLAVHVRERQPVAIWTRADKSYLIDATGRTLGLISSATAWALPRIAGEGASAEASLLFTALARYPDFEQNFGQGVRVGERRWSVVFKNGSRLELGADREAEGLEIAHTNRDLSRALLSEPVIVDVRTPGRPVVRALGLADSATSPRPLAAVQP